VRVLVTGGAGFIGSHVVDALLERGDEVVVLDNFTTGRKSNLENHFGKPSFTLIEGDIRDLKKIREALKGVDAVIHEAAITSVPFSIQNPDLTRNVNVGGTLNLLRSSLDREINRFLFASSCAVYGEQEKLPISEDASVRPLSPYADSKLAAERECLRFFRKKGLNIVILRYFNVYGPRQLSGESAGVFVKFKERLLRNQPPIIYGNGKQTRDFIHVRDVVNATLLAIERNVVGEILNLGSGKATSIKTLCDLFMKVSHKTHLKPIYEPRKIGEIRRSAADIKKMKKFLEFEPRVTIEKGVKEFWDL
jgi:nucleoside-diphosphate-sugar epimerase